MISKVGCMQLLSVLDVAEHVKNIELSFRCNLICTSSIVLVLAVLYH